MRDEMEAWIHRHRPDCILTLNPLVKKWLQNLKLALPEDISLISLSLRERDGTTGIDQRPADIGRSAVNVLVRELFLNHYGLPEIPELTLVQGQWVEGTTLRVAGNAKPLLPIRRHSPRLPGPAKPLRQASSSIRDKKPKRKTSNL
jgi:hypothetical protein